MHFSSSTSATPYSLMEMAPNLHLSIQLYIRYIHLHSRPHLRLICIPHYMQLQPRDMEISSLLPYSALPFIWCSGQRKTILSFTIPSEICICNCRCSWDRGDLTGFQWHHRLHSVPVCQQRWHRFSESHESGTDQEIHTCQFGLQFSSIG